MYTPEQINAIKESVEKQLLEIPGVVGVAVGQKITNGQFTGEISILVYVEKKKQDSALPANQVIPPEIDGVRTDVIESGTITILDAYRGGNGLQSDRAPEGTLGSFAFTTQDNPPRAVLVTNQHVVMNGKTTTPLGGDVGPVVCSICSPCCSKIIGNVTKVILDGDLDGAVAQLKPGTQILPEVEEIGYVTGTHDITPAEALSATFAVKMYSRIQREVVHGIVHSIVYSGPIKLHNNQVHRDSTNQIKIVSSSAFALAGDSGSLLLDSSNRAVGIICGSSADGKETIACPIAHVKNMLKAEIFTGTDFGQVYTVPVYPSNPTAGDPIDMGPVLAGGIAISPRSEKMKQAYQRIMSTEKGRLYDALFHKYMEEVRYLVNHNKRVATVWHRNQGPAFLVHLSNSLADENYIVPGTVKSVRLTGLLTNMADILCRYGSPGLKEDIEQRIEEILSYAQNCHTADQLISGLTNQEEQCPILQEP